MHARQRSHHARCRDQQEYPHQMDAMAQEAGLDIPSRQNTNRKPAHLHPCSTPTQTSKTSLRCSHNRGSIQGRLRHSRFPTGGRHRDSQGDGVNWDIGNHSQQVQTPLGSKEIPRADSSSLCTVLPWSGRWLRGLVLEPYQPAMFHSARTVHHHQRVKWNHGSETAAPPAPHQPTYAPDTPKYSQRARHEAAMKRYGHVRPCTGTEGKDGAVRPWSGHGDAQLWSGKGKAEKSPEIFWRRGSL